MEVQATQSAPWEVFVVCLLLLVAPTVASPRLSPLWRVASLAILMAVALFTSSGELAYLAIGASALLHADSARSRSITGAAVLAISAVVSAAVAAAIAQDALTAAFVLSCLAIALRAGVLPLHLGAASLCERMPLIQTRQLSSMIALVFVHHGWFATVRWPRSRRRCWRSCRRTCAGSIARRRRCTAAC